MNAKTLLKSLAAGIAMVGTGLALLGDSARECPDAQEINISFAVEGTCGAPGTLTITREAAKCDAVATFSGGETGLPIGLSLSDTLADPMQGGWSLMGSFTSDIPSPCGSPDAGAAIFNASRECVAFAVDATHVRLACTGMHFDCQAPEPEFACEATLTRQ